MKTRAEHREALGEVAPEQSYVGAAGRDAMEQFDLLRDIAVSLRVIAESLHEHRTFNVDARMGDTRADYGVPL